MVRPEIQRRNTAERHIQTRKNHFISGLSSCPKGLPLNFWDYLISQGCLTLNLLLKSHINPKLSAQAQLHGMFDFNATPLAPTGTKCSLHEKPWSRGSWSVRAINGWYVNRSKNYYQCYQLIPENQEVKDVRHNRTPPPRMCDAIQISIRKRYNCVK